MRGEVHRDIVMIPLRYMLGNGLIKLAIFQLLLSSVGLDQPIIWSTVGLKLQFAFNRGEVQRDTVNIAVQLFKEKLQLSLVVILQQLLSDFYFLKLVNLFFLKYYYERVN